MINFLSFLKNKKVISICLLFFVVAGIVIPQITHAGVFSGAGWGAGIGCGIGVGASLISGFFSAGLGWASVPLALGACWTGTKVGAVVGAGTSVATGSAANGFDVAIVRGIATLLYSIANSVANFATSWTADFLTEAKIKTSILTSTGFSQGWLQVRDLTNMFIVLGFVFIGICFTLRIEGYGTKKVLINLVLVALLVNFSGLFCGMIIDASNIITIHFLKGNTNLGINMVHDLEVRAAATNWDQLSETAAGYLVVAVPYILSYFIIAITFFYLAIIMLVRGAIFGIFYVLSPIAFLCWAFPATRKVWTMWWDNFIKWVFIGAQVSFFMYVASLMSRNTSGAPTSNQAVLGVNTGEILAICVVLYVAVTVARKSSAVGASAIMGFAAGTGLSAVRKIRSAGMSTLKSAGRDIQKTETGQKISSGVGRAMENIGLRKQGTTAQNFQKGMKETDARINSMDEGDKTKVATGRAFSSQGIQDKVSAIQDKIKNGKIGDLGNATEQAKAIAFAESYTKGRGGVSTIKKDALKLNPNIATNPTELKNAVQNQAPREFAKNIDSTALTPAVLGVMDDKQMTALANNGSKAKRDAMSNLIWTKSGRAKISAHAKTLSPTERKELVKNIKAASKLF